VPERLQTISAEGFRGLPKTSLDLKTRNTCVLGGNGKGKSALVDAIEFAFSGTVSRFTGAGTGNIRLPAALQNVRVSNAPRVHLSFQPCNAKATRSLGQHLEFSSKSSILQAHWQQHPPTSRFILRRAELLDFIRTADAGRHEMFMRLIGLDRLALMQDTLREARGVAERDRDVALSARTRQLEAFRTTGNAAAPLTIDAVLHLLNALLSRLGIVALEGWEDLDDRIGQVGRLRRTENAGRLDRLNAAITSLSESLPDDPSHTAGRIVALAQKLRMLETQSVDAARVPTVEAAVSYLGTHPDENTCPVCEKVFDATCQHVVEHLRERLEAQSEVAACRTDFRDTLESLRADITAATATLARDVAAGAALEHGGFEPLLAAQSAAAALATRLPSDLKPETVESIVIPTVLGDAEALRQRLHSKLTLERNALLSAETATVEDCHRLLAIARDSRSRLLESEQRARRTMLVHERLDLAQGAAANARDKAVQSVMNHIAGKVLEYYGRIHSISEMDRPECDAVTFRATGRAERGSTQLVVTFLGKAECDPKGFLSDGHLDSLGLCIYLACVKLFNPAGTLLVLDDILTSVDQEHRHRIGELLLSEFADYQLLVTTHDKYWFEQLRAAAKACGADEGWRFVEITNWSPEVGPELGDASVSETFIRANMREPEYRELGGALRAVLEDFVRKCAARLEVKVRFRIDGRYSAGDLLNTDFPAVLRKALTRAAPGELDAIDGECRQVIGAPLINALAHGDDRRLEAQLAEVSDFFDGLVTLRRRAKAANLYS
jgi:ABC-type uncharacterized transport system ATPase subunit